VLFLLPEILLYLQGISGIRVSKKLYPGIFTVGNRYNALEIRE